MKEFRPTPAQSHIHIGFLRNAGGHRPGIPTLELLEWELSGAAVASLTPVFQVRERLSKVQTVQCKWLRGGLCLWVRPAQLFGSTCVRAALQGAPAGGFDGATAAAHQPKAPGGGLSERGVLQLLFDAQLLRTALAGGRPVGGAAAAQLRFASAAPSLPCGVQQLRQAGCHPSSSSACTSDCTSAAATDIRVAAASAVVHRPHKSLHKQAELEEAPQQRPDPIERATYEPSWPYSRSKCTSLLGQLHVFTGQEQCRRRSLQGGASGAILRRPCSNDWTRSTGPPTSRTWLPTWRGTCSGQKRCWAPCCSWRDRRRRRRRCGAWDLANGLLGRYLTHKAAMQSSHAAGHSFAGRCTSDRIHALHCSKHGAGIANTWDSTLLQGGNKAIMLPDNANIVAVAPPVERFAYLPISVPSAAAAALRRAAAPALLPVAAGTLLPVHPSAGVLHE